MTKFKKSTIIDKIIAVPYYLKLLKKYNTLLGEYEVLKQLTSSRLLEDYLSKASIPDDMIKLDNENIELRTKIKELKEIIKEKKWFI